MKPHDVNRILESVERLSSAMDRLSTVNEKLFDEANVELEPTPPICPFCRMVNPVIKFEETEEELEAPILNFAFIAECANCKNTLYCIADAWIIHGSPADAQLHGQEIIQRMLGNDNGRTVH